VLENPSTYVRIAESAIPEVDFLGAAFMPTSGDTRYEALQTGLRHISNGPFSSRLQRVRGSMRHGVALLCGFDKAGNACPPISHSAGQSLSSQRIGAKF
jgi:hypothetical protein